jgi:tetratricopeptide (TPR) repeat protein
MTAQSDLKNIVRERQQKTGESYTTARRHVMRARAALLGLPEATPSPAPDPHVDAVVLKVNERSARVRILGEAAEVTFRSSDACDLVPGHIATLKLTKRWTWRGDAYANGSVASTVLDVARLGLVALPLEDGDLLDAREIYEPHRAPDPYAPLWRKLTSRPRPAFQFDPIAWGAFPGEDAEESAACRASELLGAGDEDGARELLMDVLHRDLRCIDAHGHLGNLEFDRNPDGALLHYEVGIAIGELSLPRGFDGFLPWNRLYNRPFLRCLHGYALCLWRLGRAREAQLVFERILSLNPNDNQGVRVCWALPGLRWARTGGEALDGEVVEAMRRAGEGARRA